MVEHETRLLGVGCFAGRRTLSRVLDRLMQAYSLGGWTDAKSAEGAAAAGCVALKKLLIGDPGMTEPDGTGPADEKITGFFLAFQNRRLSLSVFLERQGMRARRYTASLDDLSRLRRSRLH